MKLSEQMRARIGELVNQRAALHDAQGVILTEVEKRSDKKITTDEQSVYDAKGAEKRTLDTEIGECETRLAELIDEEERDAKAVESRKKYGAPPVQVTEPDIYIRGGGNGNSYFLDLGRAALGDPGQTGAVDRLRKHSQHVMQARALGNTGAAGGSGGEFAPPEWLVGDYIAALRAGRVTANLFKSGDIPDNVSSINLPKVLTGTTTAVQSTQNSALSQTDMTTGYVQTGWATIGGKELVAQQLLDQSAINFDTVILDDLTADYNFRVGAQVYIGTGTGSGTGATVNGLSNATIGTATVWTQATPTPAGFYGQAAKTLASFQTTRFMPPTCWVMHPRRWYWLLGQVDSNNRPLVVPQGAAYNPIATNEGMPAQGLAGEFLGLPVYIDPQVPITLGSGTNQDIVYLLKQDDLWLFEKVMAPEAFRETYADSIGVLFRLYGYVGTILNRYTASLGSISGTGLVTPTFAS